ncbi:hypothetical protein P4O66_009904, partial [Electrophorus voltai]
EAAVEAYVTEALQRGVIRPSTSPVTAGFFYVEKKGGGLRPCINYRALNQHRLYGKAEKCEFHRNCLTFLGCTLKPRVLSMDPDKVTAIQNWPKPTTVKELQRFLGFANFYRRFVCGFGDIAAPISDLLKKQGRQQLQWIRLS